MPRSDRRKAIRGHIAKAAGRGLMLSLALHGLLVALLFILSPWSSPCPEEEPAGDATGLALAGPEPIAATLRDFPPIETRPIEITPSLVKPMVVPESPALPTGPITLTATTSGSRVSSGGSGSGTSNLRLFPIASQMRSVVFVLDRSLSMGLNDALKCARRELLQALGELPPTMRFQVIAYNRQVEPIYLNGQGGFLTAEPTVIEKVARYLAELSPSGGTDHVRALKRGLAYQPDMLYFVTDADDLTPQDVQVITQQNQGRTGIYVLELNGSRQSGESRLLRELAARNRGAFRRVAPH